MYIIEYKFCHNSACNRTRRNYKTLVGTAKEAYDAANKLEWGSDIVERSWIHRVEDTTLVDIDVVVKEAVVD